MKATKFHRAVWGIAGGLIVVWLGLIDADIALSETSQIHYTITSSGDQSFPALIQQAEAIATNTITQTFLENSNITQVSVRISGERNGQEAPLLLVTVSQTDWQRQPSITPWSHYLSDARALLGFGSSAAAIAPATRVTPIASNLGDATYTDPRY